MNRYLVFTTTLTIAVFVSGMSGVAWAHHGPGHVTETSETQGNSGKTNDNANPDNNGQVETTVEGPKGQLDKDNTDCNNCTTTTSGPGNSNK